MNTYRVYYDSGNFSLSPTSTGVTPTIEMVMVTADYYETHATNGCGMVADFWANAGDGSRDLVETFSNVRRVAKDRETHPYHVVTVNTINGRSQPILITKDRDKALNFVSANKDSDAHLTSLNCVDRD